MSLFSAFGAPTKDKKRTFLKKKSEDAPTLLEAADATPPQKKLKGEEVVAGSATTAAVSPTSEKKEENRYSSAACVIPPTPSLTAEVEWEIFNVSADEKKKANCVHELVKPKGYQSRYWFSFLELFVLEMGELLCA